MQSCIALSQAIAHGITTIVVEAVNITFATCRAFEAALEERSPGDEQQQGRMRSLFHRQLAVPLLDGAATLEDYKQWEAARAGGVPPHVQKAFERARAAVQLRRAHEAAVSGDSPADANLLAAFHTYIELERAQGDPARVQLLYERVVALFPVTHELWLKYTQYLAATVKIPAVVNAVYARAVRNCPWVGRLWAAALLSAEAGGCSEEQHGALYAEALAAGMQVGGCAAQLRCGAGYCPFTPRLIRGAVGRWGGHLGQQRE